MKKFYGIFAFALAILLTNLVFAATYHITNSGYSFSPSELTVNVNDTIVFTLQSIHNAVEVSQATWDANGATPLPGGFAVPYGGGMVVMMQVGTHYYVCQAHVSIGMKGIITVSSSAGVVNSLDGKVPTSYALKQNYPNPFNPSTEIMYTIPEAGHVTLTIYSLLGEKVATLVSRVQQPGEYSVTWDATNLPSGIYFYQLRAGGFVDTKKLTLIR